MSTASRAAKPCPLCLAQQCCQRRRWQPAPSLQAATRWGWVLTPSMGYIGQGMIMGPRTAFSMLAGAIAGAPPAAGRHPSLHGVPPTPVWSFACQQITWLQALSSQRWHGVPSGLPPGAAQLTPARGLHPAGYGMLGPFAKAQGWAPGPVKDWKTGGAGWVLWVSLAIMLGDSLTSLSLLVLASVQKQLHRHR